MSDRPRAVAQPNIDTARLIGNYETMRRIRAFEETAIAAAKEGLVLGAIHPSIGQEAVAVGVCGNLRRSDILLSTHRGHGHTMVKGASVTGMMCELFGRKGGVCGGKGGSMHIAEFKVGMLGANGVVGANITIAAGAAHAIKLQGSDGVVCCIFGDGAINRGPFLEGLNWSKVFDLPVLYVCEDNGYAATTRTRTMTAGRGAAARAESLGIPSIEVDGNDIVAVDDAASELLSAVRGDGGPRFLVARTYRLTGHTAADAAPYRSEQEVSEAWRNDPIERCGNTLRHAGVADEELAAADARAAADIRRAFEIAKTAPWPDSADAFTDVQDVGAQGRDVQAERAAL